MPNITTVGAKRGAGGSLRVAALVWLLAALVAGRVDANELSTDDLFQMSLAELLDIRLQVGSRTGSNAPGRHKVAADVISADQLRRSGHSELPQALNSLLPSFSYAFSTLDDLTDQVRPFSVNGLKADQVLVLINGKRVHHGAASFVGDSQLRGGTGVDLNLIPIEAIQRIELLRDDASALYGSDAIAAVINIVLKDKPVNETVALAGQRDAGDGELFALSHNYGRDDLFLSLEFKGKQYSNTSGLDRRDYYFDGDPRNGQYRVTHRYGDPAFRSLSATLNGNNLFHLPDLYARGKLTYREGESAGFFRLPRDNRNVRAIYPDGFLPLLATTQHDVFATLGRSGEWRGFSVDLSNTFGYNHMGIDVKHSLNASLGSESPTEFDAGQLEFGQDSINLDLTRSLALGGGAPLRLALGGEIRYEHYRIIAGERASWIDGTTPVLDGPNAGADTAGGAQLFPGFTPWNETHLSRSVGAVYGEVSRQLTPKLEGTLALRDEHYSDFGNTLNGKALLYFKPFAALDIRASLASGYRAPALHQEGYYRTATGFESLPDGGVRPRENGTFPVSHPLARLLGASDLQPEKSLRANIGFTYAPSEQLELSVDYFTIAIRDRIVLSAGIEEGDNISQQAQDYMADNDIASARYFLNAVDSSSRGIDARISYQAPVFGRPLILSAQYHHNNTSVDGINIPSEIAGLAEQIFDRQEQARLTHYLPADKGIFSAEYRFANCAVLARANYFGEVLYVRSTDDPSLDQWFGAKLTYDLDINYAVSARTTLALGGQNIFNRYPDHRNAAPPFHGQGNILQYRGTGPFDYDGAFYYLRLRLAY